MGWMGGAGGAALPWPACGSAKFERVFRSHGASGPIKAPKQLNLLLFATAWSDGNCPGPTCAAVVVVEESLSKLASSTAQDTF